MIEDVDNEEIQMFRDMVLRFLEQEILPHYDLWEKNHQMLREVWNTLGNAGMLLVDMPEKYGAAGASFDICQMIQEEMCRLGLHGLATGYNIHANIVAPYILNIATEQQKDRWFTPYGHW
jgi:acyl-CoA dehydrogenase